MAKEVPVKSTKLTFRIVDLLIEPNGAGVTELAEALDVPTSSIFNHLSTLHELGFVIKRDGKYHLSSKFLYLGNKWRYQNQLYQVAYPKLKELADATGEHVLLMAEEDGFAVVLIFIQGEQATETEITGTFPGIRTHLNTSAPGKAIMAHLPDERTDEIQDRIGLHSRTEYTITDWDALEQEFADIRESGYTLDREERLVGMNGIGVPITTDTDRKVVGAIGLYGPKHRIRGEGLIDEMADQVMEVANVIEINLNYNR